VSCEVTYVMGAIVDIGSWAASRTFTLCLSKESVNESLLPVAITRNRVAELRSPENAAGRFFPFGC